MPSWPTRSGLPPAGVITTLMITATILLWAAPRAEMDPLRLFRSLPSLLDFAGKILVMPEWEYLPRLGQKMAETVMITILATSIALAASIPLGILAARNTSPHPVVFHATRSLLSAVRALPELVWALVFVSAVGLGPLPGVMALALVTMGFMPKFFAESFEVVDPHPIEGVVAHGANWLQVRLYGYLPLAMPDCIGTTIYILDHNLRSAAILGIVGAGGIGYDMVMAVRLFDYDRLLLIALSIYFIVTLLDRASDRLRAKVT